jgi:4-hydroxy-3-methylbut-2-enyl diphosphate reductase
MKVILAKHAGFCMGVRRAVGTVLERARRRRPGEVIATYGELIHNPQAVEMLRGLGVEIINSPVEAGGKVVTIRTHGIPPAEREAIAEKAAEIIDATCPHVLRIHGIIEKAVASGRDVIIFGDMGHAEVIALLAVGGSRAHLVENASDVRALPDFERVTLVSQTTQEPERYDEAAAEARKRFADVEVHSTICLSTKNRQDETAALAKATDAVVVVGGANSANTKRLAVIASESGKPVFQVESPAELDANALSGAGTVGVTAGASTPVWLISAVIDKLHEIGEKRRPAIVRAFGALVRIATGTSLYLAIGAAALTYALARLQDIPPRLPYLAASFLFIFIAHNMGRYARKHDLPAGAGPPSGPISGKSAAVLVAFAAAALLALGAALGAWSFALVLFALVTAIYYVSDVLPLAPNIRRILDIPGSKDISSAAGWGAITVGLPIIAEGAAVTWMSVLAFGICLVAVLARSITLELYSAQRDMLVGRETIPVAFGAAFTRILLVTLTVVLAIGIEAAVAYADAPSLAWWLLTLPAYTLIYLWLHHKRIVTREVLLEAVVDTKFYIAGILAFLWWHFYRI